jgi:hypothetical protein
MGAGHSHETVGDPRMALRLRDAVDALVDQADDTRTRQRAREAAESGRQDENPRTRAHARTLLLVLTLLERGEREDALDLLTNELYRSFPGRGDVDFGQARAEQAIPRAAARRHTPRGSG